MINLHLKIFLKPLGSLLLVGITFLVPMSVAQALTPGLPFGGIITFVVPCVCSGNAVIYNIPIGKTSLPALIFQPGISVLYSFYQIYKPGTYILGTYGPPTPCIFLYLIICAPWLLTPAAPLIEMVGTSQ